jgi:hypothetical protein
MKKLLIALTVEDVKIFSLYFKEDITNYTICSANIEAIELSISLGVKDLIILEPSQSEVNNIYNSDMLADQMARAIDAELGYLRSKELGLDFLALGWDYLNFYFQIYSLNRSKYLGDLILSKINDDYEVIMLMNNNPCEYYFDSMEFRLVIFNSLREKLPEVKALNVNRMGPYKANSYDHSVERLKIRADTLIHLPTCFYSNQVDRLRVKSKGDNAIDLMSPYFDVQVASNRLKLIVPVDEKYQKKADSIIKPELIKDLYKYVISDFNSINENINRLKKRAALQLDIFYYLQEGYVLDLNKIELSDHDAGLQGPILTYAKNNAVQVEIYPHSTINFQPIFASNNINRLGSIYGNTYFSSIGTGQFKNNPLKNAEMYDIKENNFKRILLVMNQIEDVAGIALFSITNLFAGLEFFDKWAKKNNILVYFKQKPSHKYSSLEKFNFTYVNDIGLDEIDACVAIGSPTSYLDRFTSKKKLCFNLSSHKLIRPEKSMLHDSTVIIEEQSFEFGFKRIIKYFEEIR